MKRTIVCENYSSTEGRCRCGCGEDLRDDLILALQAFCGILRRYYAAPVRHLITSGSRCTKHNMTTPGASKDSQHINGAAADGYFEIMNRGKWQRLEPQELAMIAIKSGLFGGVGYQRYMRDGSGIIHLDVREGATTTW